jgi:hypothetical protein
MASTRLREPAPYRHPSHQSPQASKNDTTTMSTPHQASKPTPRYPSLEHTHLWRHRHTRQVNSSNKLLDLTLVPMWPAAKFVYAYLTLAFLFSLGSGIFLLGAKHVHFGNCLDIFEAVALALALFDRYGEHFGVWFFFLFGPNFVVV